VFIKKTKIRQNPNHIQEVLEENHGDKDPQDIIDFAYLGDHRLNLQLITKEILTEQTFKKIEKKDIIEISKPKVEITMKELTEILNKNMSNSNDDFDSVPNLDSDSREKNYSIDKKIFKLYELYNKFHSKEIANMLTKHEILKRKLAELIENDSKLKESDKLQKVMENVFNLDKLTKKVHGKKMKKSDILKKSLQEKILNKPINSKIKKYIHDKYLFYQDDINYNHLNNLIDELFDEKEKKYSSDKNYEKDYLSRTDSDGDFNPIHCSYFDGINSKTNHEFENKIVHSKKSFQSFDYNNNNEGNLFKLDKANNITHNEEHKQINIEANFKKCCTLNLVEQFNNLVPKIEINSSEKGENKKDKDTRLTENIKRRFENEKPNLIQNENISLLNSYKNVNINIINSIGENNNKRDLSPISNLIISKNNTKISYKGDVNKLSKFNSIRKKLLPKNLSPLQDKDSTRIHSKPNSNYMSSSIEHNLSNKNNKLISKSIDISNSSPFLKNRLKRSFDYKTHGIDDNKLFSYLKEVTKNTKGKFLNFKDSIVFNTIEEFFENNTKTNTNRNEKTEQMNFNETQRTKMFLSSLLSSGHTLKSYKDGNNNFNVNQESKFMKYNIDLDPENPTVFVKEKYSFYNNVKTQNTTVYNNINHEINKDKINTMKNCQGSKTPFVYTKFTLNDYSSDEDVDMTKNKSKMLKN